MYETKTSEINKPLIAPGFMRPRQPVLDEPLEFGVDRPKSETLEIAEHTDPAAAFVIPNTVTTTEYVEEPPVMEEVQEENLIYAEISAEQVLAQSSFTVQAEPAEFVAEAIQENDPEPANHRKMTGFQRFILFLLVVMVMLVLATVFLYVTGRIELPNSVIVVIEKGLKLIQ